MSFLAVIRLALMVAAAEITISYQIRGMAKEITPKTTEMSL
jgi:hypothetical protein